ncbi:uncharacterized protein LOC108681898 [Hyalella azteca]|uniref:Uncharacterized protein LOC108681898 n=1 Tax=Hyalella azteca TaxID=294128 RepID=A0A8B7PJX9_HYAAZ|nr:uncharacterized protein LOC108681898 [Hyalella azteca]
MTHSNKMGKVLSDSGLQLLLGRAQASINEVSEMFMSKFGSIRISGGESWKDGIYFVTEAAEACGRAYMIPVSQFLQMMHQLTDPSDTVLRVQRFQTAVEGVPIIPTAMFNHQFVVFETQGCWWWSIEKNAEGLTLQRSRDVKAVRRRYRQQPRPEEVLLEEKNGTCDIRELVSFLYSERELTKIYHAFVSNCQHFVVDVYKHLTRSQEEKTLILEYSERYSRKVRYYL